MIFFNFVDILGVYFCYCSFLECGFLGKFVGDLFVNKYIKVCFKVKKFDWGIVLLFVCFGVV